MCTDRKLSQTVSCKFCGKQQNLSSGEHQIVNVQRKSSTAKVLNIFTIISLIVSMVICFTPLVITNNFYVMPAYFFNDAWTFCNNSSQKLSYIINETAEIVQVSQ